MMRSRTPSKTTAGRSGLLVGAVQWKLLEGAGVGGLLEGAGVGGLMEGAGVGQYCYTSYCNSSHSLCGQTTDVNGLSLLINIWKC